MARALALPAAALALLLGAPAAATTDELQTWVTLSASGSIKGDVVGQVEANFRSGTEPLRVNQTLTRGTIGWRVSPALTLSQGYGHITTWRGGRRDLTEERSYQQAQWTIGKAGRATVSSRIRLEQRFVRPGKDVGWRYRQTLRVQTPFGDKGFASIVQLEPFYAFNSTDWGARRGFDQLRGLVGVAIPVTKRTTLETGYQVQWVHSRVARDRVNHIVPLALNFRW